MSRPLHTTVVSRLQVSGCALVVWLQATDGYAVGCRCQAAKGLQRVGSGTKIIGVGTRECSWVSKGHGTGVVGFSSRCLSRFCCAWTLLTRCIFLCETLLASFAFPVIVSNSSSVLNEPASKLPEH